MNKRNVLDGMRCHRLLWWTVHEPGSPELQPDAVALDRFAEGQAVDEAARERLPDRRYQVEFTAGDLAVRADIIENQRPGIAIVEVKATRSVKEAHVDDVAIQVHAARAAGEHVAKAEVLHLEPECRAPDLSNLFVRQDVTARVERRLPVIAQAISEARRTLEGPLPEVPIGAHCGRGKEDECPFVDRCWSQVPRHHVSTLYYIGKKWEAFVANGWETIHQLPEDVSLPKPETRRQVRAVKSGHRIVEPGLRAALAAWARPIVCLDFETIGSAIPSLAGASPWEQVPAQFSVHREDGASQEWIVQGPGDPRPELAAGLVEACQGAGSVVAYFATFERGCLRHLQSAVPGLAAELTALEARLVDALPVVRDHIYDPEFAGGFSLKRVQPALVPELTGYDALEVREGQTASILLKGLVRGEPADSDQREQIRRDLLAYCAFDTYGLLKLVERLRELAS